MSLKNVSSFFKNIPDAYKAVGIICRDVPLDGKPYSTGLVGDESGQNQGQILRAIGGVCGQVLNKKTGESKLFVSLSREVL